MAEPSLHAPAGGVNPVHAALSQPHRLWRVCYWTPLRYRRRSGPSVLTAATEYKPRKVALDDLWDLRHVSSEWNHPSLVWIEPGNMTPEEVEAFVPEEVRNYQEPA